MPSGVTEPVPAAGTASPRRRGVLLRAVTIVALTVLGLGGTGTGGYLIAHELTRAPTKAELAAASTAELAQRWREFPAGTIFPATASYPLPDGTAEGTARRIGIAPVATCASAADAAVAAALRKYHCRAVLRATYTDQSGTLLVTVGVAVMPGSYSALAANGELSVATGLRPAGFSGTIASGFTPDAVIYANANARGPYLVIADAGYTDGRSAAATGHSYLFTDFAATVAAAVLDALNKPIKPCAAADVQC